MTSSHVLLFQVQQNCSWVHSIKCNTRPTSSHHTIDSAFRRHNTPNQIWSCTQRPQNWQLTLGWKHKWLVPPPGYCWLWFLPCWSTMGTDTTIYHRGNWSWRKQCPYGSRGILLLLFFVCLLVFFARQCSLTSTLKWHFCFCRLPLLSLVSMLSLTTLNLMVSFQWWSCISDIFICLACSRLQDSMCIYHDKWCKHSPPSFPKSSNHILNCWPCFHHIPTNWHPGTG